jgi:hypothetical protein
VTIGLWRTPASRCGCDRSRHHWLRVRGGGGGYDGYVDDGDGDGDGDGDDDDDDDGDDGGDGDGST